MIMIRKTPHGHALTEKTKVDGKWKQTQIAQLGEHTSVDGFAAAAVRELPLLLRDQRQSLAVAEDPKFAHGWRQDHRRYADAASQDAAALVGKLRAMRQYIGRGVVKGGEPRPDTPADLAEQVDKLLAELDA